MSSQMLPGSYGNFVIVRLAVVNIFQVILWTTWKSPHWFATSKEASLTTKPVFFRCLALHNGCHTKNLDQDTKNCYQQYRQASLVKKKFHGLKLSKKRVGKSHSKLISKCTVLPLQRSQDWFDVIM